MKTTSPSLRIAFVLVLLAAAGAVVAAGHAARTLLRTEIPQGFAVGSGNPPLELQVEVAGGRVVSVAAADPGAGNVSATGSASDGQTMLSIRHDLGVALKFDLYVSADGEHFEYASTCAVTPAVSGFEMWQRPIRAFALGNPRVVSGGNLSCD